MKINRISILLFSIFLFACSDDESTQPSTSSNNSTTIKHQLFGEAWQSQSGGGFYTTGFDKRMEIYLFKESNWNLCKDGKPYTTHVSIIFPARLGRIELANNPELLFIPRLDSARSNLSSGTGAPNNLTNYIQIDQLDTVGVGHVKGSYHFTFFNSFGSTTTEDEIAGTFDLELCRDANYLEYQNRNLSGEYNGQAWNFQSGAANKTSNLIRLSSQLNKDSCMPFINEYPRIEVALPKLEERKYSSANNNQSDSTVAFYYYEDSNTWTYFLGGMEITQIDSTNNQLSGKIDAFSDPRLLFSNKWVYLNGNFSVKYCD